MTLKHTPLPWTIFKAGIGEENGDGIASLWREGEEREANAALIVRAVNAHEDLVKALDHAVNIIREHVLQDALGIDGEGNFEEPGGHLTRCWPVLDEHLHYMDAALALSRGETP